jgi:serine/threonine-protein phosphatase 2A activator
MYFSAIQFIFDVKKGPFWEHSPILFNISGIKDGWGKINKGMLKMYDAEVLGKFPVVQHFPFGHFFKWERDPEAAKSAGPSVHSQQQPPSLGTATNTSSAPGTAAPWAQQTSSSQPQTGMPSTRAPWASAGAASVPGTAPMAAPWASTTASRVPPSGASNRNYPPTAPSTSTYGRMPPPAAAAKGSGTEAPWKRNG